MADNKQIIELYTQLAQQPEKDFGWDKGLENAKAHGYDTSWFEQLPSEIWQYCAAVGNPFKDAVIHRGDTVVDLGCGAGVDLLVAALLTGNKGRAIGVDITPKMVEKARYHAALAGFSQVEVLESSFDDLEIEDESVDVVLSNGAINLTSCKQSVFTEIYRILKPEGRLYFADMIDISIKSEDVCGESKENSCCASSADDWANCVAGTLSKQELIEIISEAGFRDVVCTGETHYTTADTTLGATFKATKIPKENLRKAHWDMMFSTRDITKVLWHELSPKRSLTLIEDLTESKDDAIIDVGCGASLLVDELLRAGFTNLTLLDNSQKALDIVDERLPEADVTYLCQDILTLDKPNGFKLWHDRAAFHFLLDQADQEQYFKVLMKSLQKGGKAIINTFHPQGPTECAGLDIKAYDEEMLKKLLPEGLKLLNYIEFNHITPKNTEQAYSCFILEKTTK